MDQINSQAPGQQLTPMPVPLAAPALPALPTQSPSLPGKIPAPVAAAQTVAAKDDGDLIEKEWVDKAKEIVERNREDPYKQSEELTLFKADYMKKRYGKTIKVSP